MPHSRLVLAARPVLQDEWDSYVASYRTAPKDQPPDAMLVDNQPQNVALRRAFRLGPSDVVANRSGHATGGQRLRLVSQNAWAFPLAILLPASSWFSLASVVATPSAVAAIGTLVAAALTIVVVRLVVQVAVDAANGKLDIATGRVRISFDESDATGTVGIPPVTFSMSHALGRALQPEGQYRVYVFHRSRHLAGAEFLHG